MRRGGDGKSGTNTAANSGGPSKTTSEADGGSGSDGGNDDNKDKSALTREQREARYREARQRIFGSAESAEGEAPDPTGSGEDKDVSRSSSASGKKKNKKQRNYDDDFEARSRFNAYYPHPYSIPGYGGDPAMYYAGFPAQMQNPQFSGMNPNMSPPPNYGSGYPVAMPQDAQTQYGWPGQQYPSPNTPMAYPNYGPVQNGYDLSADFQQSMQFQSPGMPSQMTPKMTNPPMASYPDTYQPQPQPPPMTMNGAWTQMSPRPAFSTTQPPYSQNGPGNRPIPAPIQGPGPGQYPYGQFPTSPYNGMPNRNQHPLPGSFNRQQFNPQSQAFIPGGRNAPYQMQPNMAQMPPQGMNGYASYPMSAVNPMGNPMMNTSPPMAHAQAYGTPQGMQNNNPAVNRPNNMGLSQTPQMVSSQMAAPHQSSSQSDQTQRGQEMQSSIAKWGTPAHLPPKPPAPAQTQAAKFNIPGNNNFSSSLPRVPGNNLAPGYTVQGAPMIRGPSGGHGGAQ